MVTTIYLVNYCVGSFAVEKMPQVMKIFFCKLIKRVSSKLANLGRLIKKLNSWNKSGSLLLFKNKLSYSTELRSELRTRK